MKIYQNIHICAKQSWQKAEILDQWCLVKKYTMNASKEIYEKYKYKSLQSGRMAKRWCFAELCRAMGSCGQPGPRSVTCWHLCILLHICICNIAYTVYATLYSARYMYMHLCILLHICICNIAYLYMQQCIVHVLDICICIYAY